MIAGLYNKPYTIQISPIENYILDHNIKKHKRLPMKLKILKNQLFVVILAIAFGLKFCHTQQTDKDLASYRNTKSISDKLFTVGANQKSYQNLFNTYQDILVETKLLRKTQTNLNSKNHQLKQKMQILKQRNTSIILQSEFLKMYKNRLTFKFPLEFTAQLIQQVRENRFFIQNTFYVSINNAFHKVQSQAVPLMGFFKHTLRSGLQHFFHADTKLFEYGQAQVKILNNFEIYLFQIKQELIFPTTYYTNPEKQSSQLFRIYPQPSNKNIQYYYPKPLTEKINTIIEENYVNLEGLQEGDTQWIKFEIKVAPDTFPFMFYGAERLYNLSETLQMRFDQFEDDLHTTNLHLIQPIMVQYIKSLFLNESLLKWGFFIASCIISLFIPFATFLQFYYEVQIYKRAKHHKGMSKYTLFTLLFIDLIILVSSNSIMKLESSIISGLVVIGFTVWKISRLGSIQLTESAPFIVFNEEGWYKRYSAHDKRAFRQIIYFIIGFVILAVFYPLIFQQSDFFKYWLKDSDQVANRSTMSYFLQRISQILAQNRFVFAILPQIFLNYSLKTCNGLSWKWLIWTIPVFSINNMVILTSNSWTDAIFYLKQEILIWILFWQKFTYGNNLSELFAQDKHNQKGQHRQEDEQNLDKELSLELKTEQQIGQKDGQGLYQKGDEDMQDNKLAMHADKNQEQPDTLQVQFMSLSKQPQNYEQKSRKLSQIEDVKDSQQMKQKTSEHQDNQWEENPGKQNKQGVKNIENTCEQTQEDKGKTNNFGQMKMKRQ